MTRPEQTRPATNTIPRVNIGWLHPFFEILDEAGASWEELLERAHLPVLASDDSSTLVPTSQVYAFAALAARETRLDDLGLQAGSRFDIAPLLPDAESAWTRPGAYRSIRGFIDVALESSTNVDMWIEARTDPEPTTEFFYRGTFGPDHPAFTTVEQFMIALMVRWTRYGAGDRWNPSQVQLRADSVPAAAIRALAGDAKVLCGQSVTSIAFPAQRFAGRMESLPEPNSLLWKRHRRSLKSATRLDDLAGSLRLVLPAYLPDGSPDIRQAARLANMSLRTFQRRLREQGVTYSQLLEELRHDLAIYFLRDPTRHAAEVSRELGYRDPAIFTRAFRRWTGSTPSEFRRSFSVS